MMGYRGGNARIVDIHGIDGGMKMSSKCNYYKVIIQYETWANDAEEAMENADIILEGGIKCARYVNVWDETNRPGEPVISYTHPKAK